MFRFIHTADLHLDSPLKALSRRNRDLDAVVGVATRVAFGRIIEKAIETILLTHHTHALELAEEAISERHASIRLDSR